MISFRNTGPIGRAGPPPHRDPNLHRRAGFGALALIALLVAGYAGAMAFGVAR